MQGGLASCCVCVSTGAVRSSAEEVSLLLMLKYAVACAFVAILASSQAHAEEGKPFIGQRRMGRPMRRSMTHIGENGAKTLMYVDGHVTREPLISLDNDFQARCGC